MPNYIDNYNNYYMPLIYIFNKYIFITKIHINTYMHIYIFIYQIIIENVEHAEEKSIKH